MKNLRIRCGWVTAHPLYLDYHDNEWGVAVFDERLLFEFLVLEGMQAGLSWLTVLKKRESFRENFDNFNPEKIARYDKTKTESLLTNPSIIRNRLKINACVTNAQAFLKLKKEQGSFTDYLWHFTDGKVLQNQWQNLSEVPSSTPLSDQLAKDLKKRGFKFVGSTICYAFMQAVGMVNDHTLDCFRHAELSSLKS